ncbi:hypothetical protein AKJ16_DCAP02799 [Drosera capensis]
MGVVKLKDNRRPHKTSNFDEGYMKLIGFKKVRDEWKRTGSAQEAGSSNTGQKVQCTSLGKSDGYKIAYQGSHQTSSQRWQLKYNTPRLQDGAADLSSSVKGRLGERAYNRVYKIGILQ